MPRETLSSILKSREQLWNDVAQLATDEAFASHPNNDIVELKKLVELHRMIELRENHSRLMQLGLMKERNANLKKLAKIQAILNDSSVLDELDDQDADLAQKIHKLVI